MPPAGAPLVVPQGGEDTAMKLRSLLGVKLQREGGGLGGRGLGCGVMISSFVFYKGYDHLGEGKFCLQAYLHIVLVCVAFKAGDGLIGTLELCGPYFGAAEEVAVGVG